MSEKRPTKAEREAKEANAAHEKRLADDQHAKYLTSHMGDPMTDPSAGDPPPAISDAGDRLGTIPVTRNAVADTEQAKHEGLQAAEQGSPTKAEKQSGKREHAKHPPT